MGFAPAQWHARPCVTPAHLGHTQCRARVLTRSRERLEGPLVVVDATLRGRMGAALCLERKMAHPGCAQGVASSRPRDRQMASGPGV